MKKIWSVAKYKLQYYGKGYTFVMPLIIICIFMRFMYSVKPMDVVSGYIITVNFLFLFMTWIGMTETNRENRALEQIVELRVNKAWAYFAGKMLFLLMLSLIIAALCTVWPFVQNIIEKGTFFKREYLPEDMVNGFLLNLGSAYSGVMLGSFLHPDVCKDRKTAIALTVLFALLADLQGILLLTKPVLKYILWFLPNVALVGLHYGNEEYFNLDVSLSYFCILMIYAVVYRIIGSLWQYKKRA